MHSCGEQLLLRSRVGFSGTTRKANLGRERLKAAQGCIQVLAGCILLVVTAPRVRGAKMSGARFVPALVAVQCAPDNVDLLILKIVIRVLQTQRIVGAQRCWGWAWHVH